MLSELNGVRSRRRPLPKVRAVVLDIQGSMASFASLLASLLYRDTDVDELFVVIPWFILVINLANGHKSLMEHDAGTSWNLDRSLTSIVSSVIFKFFYQSFKQITEG